MKLSHQIIGAIAFTAYASVSTFAIAASCPADFGKNPVHMLVGYGAGGGTDTIARTIAADMEERQGWTVVVDNKAGAGGGVMAAALLGMAPDGHTIGVAATGTVALNPYLLKDTPFHYDDFGYIGTAMQINYGLVSIVDRPYSTLDEFIAYAKEQGSATIATGGKSQEILIDQMAKHYGVELIAVPGKGAADALQTALGGHVDATTQGSKHVQQILAGKMNQLASLVDHRVPYAPDSPTLVEKGLNATIDGQTIFMLPKGAEPAVQTCLEEALDEAVNSDAYAELMKRLENAPVNLGAKGTEEIIAKNAVFYKDYLSSK